MSEGNEAVIKVPGIIEVAVTTGQADKAGVSLARKVQIGRLGAEFRGDMGYEQWAQWMMGLKNFKDFFHVLLADGIRYGRDKFGEERVEAVLDQCEFDFADCGKATSIGNMAKELRTTQLTPEHWFVIGMDLKDKPDQHPKWINLAVKHELSPLELRKSIQEGKVVRQDDVDQRSGRGAGLVTIQGLRFTFDNWERKVGGKEAILKWKPDQKRAWLNEVAPIVELAEAVKNTLA